MFGRAAIRLGIGPHSGYKRTAVRSSLGDVVYIAIVRGLPDADVME